MEEILYIYDYICVFFEPIQLLFLLPNYVYSDCRYMPEYTQRLSLHATGSTANLATSQSLEGAE